MFFSTASVKKAVKSMFKFELKKIFSRFSGKLALIAFVAAIVISAYTSVNAVAYYGEEGTLYGVSAAKQLQKESEKWRGPLDEEMLRRVIEENTELLNSPLGKSEKLEDQDLLFAKTQGFLPISYIIGVSYSGELDSFIYDKINSLTPDDAVYFYQNRLDCLNKYLSLKNGYTDADKAFITSRFQNIQTPFYYSYHEGWDNLCYGMRLITICSLFIVLYLICGIFSDEFKYKADSVIFCTKRGRNESTRSKILCGVVITSAVYWAMVILFTLIVLACLGAEGWNCPIQLNISSWGSMYNINYLQEYLLIVFSSYIGILFCALICMYISSKSKNALTALIAPVALLFGTSTVIGMFSGRGLMLLSSLLPSKLMEMSSTLKLFNVYTFGSKSIDLLPVLFILYVVLSVALIPAIYRDYSRKEIS